MVIHTNEGSFPEEERSAKRARTKEVLLRWYEKLRKMGIEMTVENVGYPLKDNLLFDYDEFVRLFAELPDEIGCLIDTGHAMLNGWDIVKLIKTLGPRIRGYHLNNNDGKHDSHYPLYDSEGYYSPQQIDEMLRAIAIYSPERILASSTHQTAGSLQKAYMRIYAGSSASRKRPRVKCTGYKEVLSMAMLVLFGTFLLTMICGLPVALTMGASAALYIICFTDTSPLVIMQQTVSGVNNYVLLAAPFFIMAGALWRVGVFPNGWSLLHVHGRSLYRRPSYGSGGRLRLLRCYVGLPRLPLRRRSDPL